MNTVVKPHKKGGIQIRDPYYEPVMKILDAAEELVSLGSMLTLDGETISSILGEIAAEINELGITISALAVLRMLIAKAQDQIYRWAVVNISTTAQVSTSVSSPSIKQRSDS